VKEITRSQFAPWLPGYPPGDPLDMYLEPQRQVDPEVIEMLSEQYVIAARARGFTERVITLKHALQSAFVPRVAQSPLEAAPLVGTLWYSPGCAPIPFDIDR